MNERPINLPFRRLSLPLATVPLTIQYLWQMRTKTIQKKKISKIRLTLDADFKRCDGWLFSCKFT